ncbi:S-adenosyl-l-methionine hydroxide adenosyltransferase family protein [Nostoc sp. FACHB-280]|uniref:SAM hydrolase/SAM-dependent halogenase family protein n=1 Tax=Nostoc sp. FACHB-280 TaxID=2692839 RepID=UPI00168AC049|nr:SAM-dependent chlorinase/fluorinase [Nostoc sp. FACHB-280]MBD2498291.1 SAM-dependent chlorinase/fluorinase [Nostoc sp. FACHB-280]
MAEKAINTRSHLTLLSDFGDRDVYVGVMKGIIAQINPEIRVIDLTHQIPPQNLVAARFCLMNAYPYFPDGTVHIAVVDPGVGGNRRAIAVEFAGGFLVGPDNGIFSGVLSQTPAVAAVELTNPDYWLTPQPSRTFHGRDIFAPVGANLASGVPLKYLGNEINPTTLLQLGMGKCQTTSRGVLGHIQYIDHFGNLISNIPQSYVEGKTWYVQIAGLTIPGCETYSNGEVGEAVALVGSHGWVEIAINGGNANLQLQISYQDTLEVINY